MSQQLRNNVVCTLLGCALLLAGCGGSGGGSNGGQKTTPTANTRAKVQAMHQNAFRGTNLAGFQTQSFAFAHNGSVPHPGTSSGNAGPHSYTMPMIGAFIRNVASVPPSKQKTYLNAAKNRAQGETLSDIFVGGEPSPAEPPFPISNFYYDYYLGLWVSIDSQPGKLIYSLYEDEAKTKPAGSIETTQPTDYSVYPQEYKSSYTFTAGSLAGSHGSSENVTNADFSGKATYENTYVDGGKDSGESAWSGLGDFTWKSRSDSSDGKWMESTGSWRANGSGGAKISSSDGYSAEYIYNADGSGRARITGPDAGLPVTIVWDAFGNTTITYADGTVEHIPGWGDGTGTTPPPGSVEPVTNTPNKP